MSDEKNEQTEGKQPEDEQEAKDLQAERIAGNPDYDEKPEGDDGA